LSTCFIEWCKWLHLCSFCVHLQAFPAFPCVMIVLAHRWSS
jgi:hypothetical protein